MTLTDFLLARIAEDEVATSELLRRAQEHELDCGEPQLLGKRIPGWYDWPKVQALAARVLAECEAKRRIIQAASAYLWDDIGRKVYDSVLARLATPYAGHPDYRAEWRP